MIAVNGLEFSQEVSIVSSVILFFNSVLTFITFYFVFFEQTTVIIFGIASIFSLLVFILSLFDKVHNFDLFRFGPSLLGVVVYSILGGIMTFLGILFVIIMGEPALFVFLHWGISMIVYCVYLLIRRDNWR